MGSIPPQLQELAREEQEAEQVLIFDSAMIPWLLQTEDTMDALWAENVGSQPGVTDPDREAKIAERRQFRLDRQAAWHQRRLTANKPPEYWAVIGARVLKRNLSPQQRAHLLGSQALTGIHIRVLPEDSPTYADTEGPFSLLDGWLVEGYAAGETVLSTNPSLARHYQQVFSKLWEASVSLDEALAVQEAPSTEPTLSDVLRGLWQQLRRPRRRPA